MMIINRLKKMNILWILPVLLFSGISCLDTDETINSQVTPNQFFQNDRQFVSALGEAYTILGTGSGGAAGLGGNEGYTSIQEVTSDEMVITRKGPDWFDGGNWIRLHRHKFRTDEGQINNAWIHMFGGVNSTNRLISQFETLLDEGNADPELAQSFIAELKSLRSYYYLQLLDTFGNVPIIEQFDESVAEPATNSRQEVFEFVENTLISNVDLLSTDVQDTYGRVNKFVAHMMLAKLYLNAEEYIGEPKWEEALEQIELVEDGGYSLAPNFLSNFSSNNSGSPEIIFAVPYDRSQLRGFQWHLMTLQQGGQQIFDLQQQPWNGYSTLSEFYNMYIDPELNPGPEGEVIGLDGRPTQGTRDDRLGGFLVGLQVVGGDTVKDASFDLTNDENDEERGTVDPGPPLRHIPRIDELEPNGNRERGARITKYEFEAGINQNMNNDFVIYRFADVLLMKAEVLYRLGREDEALPYINQVRSRAGVTDFTDLTLDKILEERGREFIYENLRRQDLIRFDGKEGGKTRFNDPWRFKDESPAFRNLFPIPQEQLEANPNLEQNPGY